MKAKKVRKGFTQIPNDLITDWKLSNDAFRMYLILLSHDLTVYKINYKTLYAQLNVSVSTGTRVMKELLDTNLVKRTKFFKDGRYTYTYNVVNYQCSNTSTGNTSTGNTSTGNLTTIKKTNLKEEQTVPFKEEKLVRPLQADSHSFSNEKEQAVIEPIKIKNKEDKNLDKLKEVKPSHKENTLTKQALELLEEVIGFNPIDKPEEAIKALESLKEENSSLIRTTPLSKRQYNIDSLIAVIHTNITL